MNDADNLNRLCFPDIDDNVRIEIPEAVFAAQQFVVVMTDAWGTPKRTESIVEALSQIVGSIRAVLGEIKKDISKIVLGRWSKNEKVRH
ncbi:MAG TPA: hypothetical protein VMZ52_16130 [Bryobacteraceae bacterium]|nr:hypothetical protein [Bryobacteraceae bacterium]